MTRLSLPVCSVFVLLLFGSLTGYSEESPKPITAEDLTKEFTKDQKATKAKYGNKTIVVTGKVLEVKVEPMKAAQITLSGHKSGKNVLEVLCYFPENLGDQVKKFKKGDKVKIRGKFSEFSREDDIKIITCDSVE